MALLTPLVSPLTTTQACCHTVSHSDARTAERNHDNTKAMPIDLPTVIVTRWFASCTLPT